MTRVTVKIGDQEFVIRVDINNARFAVHYVEAMFLAAAKHKEFTLDATVEESAE